MQHNHQMRCDICAATPKSRTTTKQQHRRQIHRHRQCAICDRWQKPFDSKTPCTVSRISLRCDVTFAQRPLRAARQQNNNIAIETSVFVSAPFALNSLNHSRAKQPALWYTFSFRCNVKFALRLLRAARQQNNDIA